MQNHLLWQAKLNDSFVTTYTVKILHHSINGVVPQPNMLINVIDEYCGIKGVMLIYKTTHGWNDKNGDYLELTLLKPGSFSNTPNPYLQTLKITERF